MVIAVVDVVLSAIAVLQAFKALQTALKVAGKKALRTSAQNGVTGEKLPNSQGATCNQGKCFIAGTKVKTEDGYKNIEEVEVGDKVLAYDEETGKQAYKEVVRLFRNESKEWTIVKVNGEEIESTSGHKYYLPEKKEWRSAEELKEGDKVLLWDGKYGIIESVKNKHYDNAQTTYNFEVEDFHTYYVGTGVCVHNKNCSVTKDPLTGEEVGRFIVDENGNIMIEPKGGSTVAGHNPVDTHTLYSNGSNYQRLNPQGHGANSIPHGHGHLRGTGSGLKGQGPSIDIYGNVVPRNSPAAHWKIKFRRRK